MKKGPNTTRGKSPPQKDIGDKKSQKKKRKWTKIRERQRRRRLQDTVEAIVGFRKSRSKNKGYGGYKLCQVGWVQN